MNNELIEMIKLYQPKDEEEKETKKIMLDYIYKSKNILDREEFPAHFVSSAWVFNKDRTKILMVHHNIYNSYMWTGGHAEGDSNLLNVAIKETREETGITSVKPISEDIYMLDIFPVKEHIRKGKKVPAHFHLNTTYILEADEFEPLKVQDDENSEVVWISIDEAIKNTTKEGMLRMLNKLKRLLSEKGL